VITQIFYFFIESFGTVMNRICADNKLTIHVIFHRAVKERYQMDQLALARQVHKYCSAPLGPKENAGYDSCPVTMKFAFLLSSISRFVY
jgi:hypothetical protein